MAGPVAHVLASPKPSTLATFPIAFELASAAPARELPAGQFPLWDELTPVAPEPPRNAPILAAVVPPDYQIDLQPGGLHATASFAVGGVHALRLAFLDTIPSVTWFGGKECMPRTPGSYECGLEAEVQIVRVVLDRAAGPRVPGRILARVDRTPACPLDASAVARAFVERTYQSMVGGALAPKLEAMIEASHRQNPASAAIESGEKDTTLFARLSATVDESKRGLTLVFYARRADQRAHVESRTIPGSFGCHAPPGADCAPRMQPPSVQTVRASRTWFAEIAIERRVGFDGSVLGERERLAARPPAPVDAVHGAE